MTSLKIQGGAVTHELASLPEDPTDLYRVNPRCDPGRLPAHDKYTLPEKATCKRCLTMRALSAAR